MFKRLMYFIFGESDRPSTSNAEQGVIPYFIDNIDYLKRFASVANNHNEKVAPASCSKIIDTFASVLEKDSFVLSRRDKLSSTLNGVFYKSIGSYEPMNAPIEIAWFANHLLSQFEDATRIISLGDDDSRNFIKKIKNLEEYKSSKTLFDWEINKYGPYGMGYLHKNAIIEIINTIELLISKCREIGTDKELEHHIKESQRPNLGEFKKLEFSSFVNDLKIAYPSFSEKPSKVILDTYFIKNDLISDGEHSFYKGLPDWVRSLVVLLVLSTDYYLEKNTWRKGTTYRDAIETIFLNSSESDFRIGKKVLYNLYALGLPSKNDTTLTSHSYSPPSNIFSERSSEAEIIIKQLHPLFFSPEMTMEKLHVTLWNAPDSLKEFQDQRILF